MKATNRRSVKSGAKIVSNTTNAHERSKDFLAEGEVDRLLEARARLRSTPCLPPSANLVRGPAEKRVLEVARRPPIGNGEDFTPNRSRVGFTSRI
jgi:hypothetical protein